MQSFGFFESPYKGHASLSHLLERHFSESIEAFEGLKKVILSVVLRPRVRRRA